MYFAFFDWWVRRATLPAYHWQFVVGCGFHYFIRNSIVALLEGLFTRSLCVDFEFGHQLQRHYCFFVVPESHEAPAPLTKGF